MKQRRPGSRAGTVSTLGLGCDVRQIDEVPPKGVAAGERYPDMSSVNR